MSTSDFEGNALPGWFGRIRQSLSPQRAREAAAELERLRRDSELFNTFLANTTDFVYFKDRDSRFLRVSRSMLNDFGAREEDLIGISDFEYLPAIAEQTFADEQKIIQTGQPLANIEEMGFDRSGNFSKWVRTSKSALYSGGGEIIGTFGITRDISTLKQAELQQLQSSERMQQIVATQQEIALIDHDLQRVLQMIVERSQALTSAGGAMISLIEEGRLSVIAASGAYSSLVGTHSALGGSAAERVLRGQHSFLAEDAARDPRLNQERVARLGERSHICAPLFRGERVIGCLDVTSLSLERPLLEDDRRTIELLCVVLSAAIDREEEYKALSRFQTIYDAAPFGIVLVHPDGGIIESNHAFQEISGYSAKDLRGLNHLTDLIHPGDLEQTMILREQLINRQIDGFQIERRYLCKDGTVVWTESTVSQFQNAGAGMVAMVMVQDISKRRMAEEHLHQAQKTEAIGQLTAGIAHDFNNLLMGILGYLELARIDCDSPTAVTQYLEEAQAAGLRATALTKQLLSFGRRQMLQPEAVNLNQLLGETIDMLSRLLGEHITITSQLDPELPCVFCDPTHMQQVLLNLALNARDAMPQGGQLQIATTVVDLDSSTDLALTPGRYVELTVRDDGFGMSPEVSGHIFEPFFTTKEVGEGTGLGLSSVYGTIKQSLGEITVSSEPGQGSTFRIYLPAHAVTGEQDGSLSSSATTAVGLPALASYPRI